MTLNYSGHFINPTPLYTSLEQLGNFAALAVTLSMLSISCLFHDIGNEILTSLELLQNPR